MKFTIFTVLALMAGIIMMVAPILYCFNHSAAEMALLSGVILLVLNGIAAGVWYQDFNMK